MATVKASVVTRWFQFNFMSQMTRSKAERSQLHALYEKVCAELKERKFSVETGRVLPPPIKIFRRLIYLAIAISLLILDNVTLKILGGTILSWSFIPRRVRFEELELIDRYYRLRTALFGEYCNFALDMKRIEIGILDAIKEGAFAMDSDKEKLAFTLDSENYKATPIFPSTSEGKFEIRIHFQLRADKNIKYRTNFFYGRTYIRVSLIRYSGERFDPGIGWGALALDDIVQHHLILKPAKVMPLAWSALLNIQK